MLDLDETLLHSSIVPLPTYDIVFPVHFNSVNYQEPPRFTKPTPHRSIPRKCPPLHPSAPRKIGIWNGLRDTWPLRPQVFVRKRPHMDYFMEEVSKMFEIVVFTASQKESTPTAA